MLLPEVVFVGGDTVRSRAYIQALCSNGLMPEAVCIIPARQMMPGQKQSSLELGECAGSWGRFLPEETLEETCVGHGLAVLMLPNSDINSEEAVQTVSGLPGKVCIFSGFGGVLLRASILNCGKKFLHIHGGWLPDYKGSTTNHYSALAEGFCGASAIFMSEEIDTGPILMRKQFPLPADLSQLELTADAVFRAEVLCEVMRYYLKKGHWPSSGMENHKSQHYYIMHPVLRHVLNLRK